ncbi:hypothetical protein [Leifsonia sp. Le1]|uniref:hypothetical protein n=1 Tax=Leifsonia sp. Le1 TaxID=3404918 RepID=UPI003EC045DE
MTKDTDPLIGADVSPEDDALYAAWSEQIEADDIHTPDTAQAFEGDDAQRAARALLDEIVGADELDKAIGRGRPSLAGAGKQRGESPKVQVRLPHDLDAALRARAAIEHRKPSEVAREAIALYLRNAS